MDYQGPGGRACFNCRWWLAFYLLPCFVALQPCAISTRPIACVGFPSRSLARSKERAVLRNGFKQNPISFLLFASLVLVIGCLWGGEDLCNTLSIFPPETLESLQLLINHYVRWRYCPSSPRLPKAWHANMLQLWRGRPCEPRM